MLSLGVHVPDTNPILNGILGLNAPLFTAVTVATHALTARVGAVVTHIDPTPITVGVFTQSRYSAAKKILEFLNPGANPVEITARLERIEVAFFTLGLPAAPFMVIGTLAFSNALPDATALNASLGALLPSQRKILIGFARAINPTGAVSRLIDLMNVAGGLPGANLADLTEMVNAVNIVRPAALNRFSGITTAAFPALRTLLGIHPPDSVFAGFAQWGPGDHGAHNVKYHFLKHVCYAASDHDDPHECAWWWNELGINLTIDQMTSFFTPSTFAKERARILAFFDATGVIPAQRANFLAAGGVSLYPACIHHMITTYQDTYENYALAKSAHLTNKLVQSNGTLVFISGGIPNLGAPSRGIFVIGRLDAGVLGISACYACTDLPAKQAGAASNKVWNLL
jgi:hypothetical protein